MILKNTVAFPNFDHELRFTVDFPPYKIQKDGSVHSLLAPGIQKPIC